VSHASSDSLEQREDPIIIYEVFTFTVEIDVNLLGDCAGIVAACVGSRAQVLTRA